MNKENLAILAEHLRTVNPKKFSMLDFRFSHVFGKTMPVEYIEAGDCGHGGDPLGHAVFCRGLAPAKSDFIVTGLVGKRRLDFIRYGERTFGLAHTSSHWNWVFSPDWYMVDNSPISAAQRIEYLIEYGRPPKDWAIQLRNVAKVSKRHG